MSADESAVRHISPNSTIVARDLAIVTSGSTGAISKNVLFTLMDDGTATSLSCTIQVPQNANPNTLLSCNSGAATATIGPGSQISLQVTVGGGNGGIAAPVQFGWRATMP